MIKLCLNTKIVKLNKFIKVVDDKKMTITTILCHLKHMQLATYLYL